MPHPTHVLEPLPAELSGPDRRHQELARERFGRLTQAFPAFATYLGIHSEDDRLADMSRDAVLEDLEADGRYLAEVEGLDVTAMSDAERLERELSILAARWSIFDTDTHRVWERRATACDEIGDGLFILLARDFAPLAERLEAMTARLEAAPDAMIQVRSRLAGRPVRLWNELELDATTTLPALFDEIVAAGRAEWGDGSAPQRRLDAAARTAREGLESYAGWLKQILADATDEFALGREAYDELISLRAFDGLTADEILEIGYQQLDANHDARRTAALELDPDATEAEVLDRVKSDHPATFEEALEGYRSSMERAREHVLAHGIATLPPGERLSVMPTPEYLRKVMPFAAYFAPAKFDADPRGTYIVTPSVDGDAGAMREHSWASISNTSIHEAYPGHHQQFAAAMRNPSIPRLLVEAPEFIEGWGMYCEQMMREQGFDTTPAHRVIMYTDAIWRACRIILDIRLHRGEMGIAEAIEFLVDHTGFERPNAAAEVHRYTSTPTYQLSYLLGKVLLLRLRDDERRRLGGAFDLRRFHDALLYSGSLPISFHRRLLAGEGGGPTMPDTSTRPAPPVSA